MHNIYPIPLSILPFIRIITFSLLFMSMTAPVCANKSIYTDDEHTKVTLAIRNGKYIEAVRLIEESGSSKWLVSIKVFKEVAEPPKRVAIFGSKPAEDLYPLLAAVAALGEVSVAKALLKNGAQVNAQLPEEGSTPLMFAAKMRNLMMVRLLLSHGADPTITTTGNRPEGALSFSIELADSGDGEQVALELLAPPYADQILKNRSALQIRDMLETAAYRGLGQVIRRFKELGVKISQRNQLGASLLHYALMGGKEEGCKQVALYLIEHGLDPNQHYATDSMLEKAKQGHYSPWGRREGKTPLLLAIDEKADSHCIEDLIKSGADVNVPSLDGITPLLSAKNHGREDLIELFFRYGAVL
jgi:ankyrin repeat protein